MKVIYELQACAPCPVASATDVYQLTVRSDHMIEVERINAAVERLTKEAIFQEDLTELLAKMLDATSESIGWHSGVKVTCTSEPIK